MKHTHLLIAALLLCLLPFTGCLKDRKELVGTWTIDEIKVNGYDVKEKMSTNTIAFKFEGVVVFAANGIPGNCKWEVGDKT